MKTKKSFKQPCPSCGAGVVIKDPKLIGKKVDCPECKFRFVAEAPKDEPDEEKDDSKDKKKKPAAKDAKNGKAAKEKPAADEDKGKKKKKKAGKLQFNLGSNKQKLGLALGAVGLVVLGVAAFLIMNNNPAPVPSGPGVVKIEVPPTPPKVDEPKKDPDKEPEVVPMPMPPMKEPPALAPAGTALTNLLPGDADHVARIFLKTALSSVLGAASKEAYPLDQADDQFRQQLGFPLSAVDAVIRADRYAAPAWSYTVVHLTAAVDEAELVKALGLNAEAPIKSRNYFSAKAPLPWVEQLGKLAVATPETDRHAAARPEAKLFVHIVDPQTIMFADKAPVLAFLEANGKFPNAGGNVPFGETSYLTIKPELKAILDRMEKEAGETILFCSATAMDAARVSLNSSDPRLANRVFWQFRQLWDVAHLLETNRSRVQLLGTGVYRKDSNQYLLRNEIACLDDLDAQELEKELHGRVAPQLAGFLEKVIGKKVKLPEIKKDDMPPMPPPVVEDPPKEEPKQSAIRLTKENATLDFQLDLVLDQVDYNRLYSATALMLFGLRSELNLASRQIQRDRLAHAAAELGEKGLTIRQVEPGRFPPGAFKRPPSTLRTIGQPNQRVSWMAGLLPFLGQDSIYRRIDFNSSWQDPANLMAARTLVPQFLDPTYPDESFYVSHPNLNYRVAGTHFVGIAGVGLDAASYGDNPAYLDKRGVLSYERSATLDEVRAGHGLENTILMMQIPYDGAAGVTPWLAGGGATLRGVPEKNSIESFVLGRDRDGKPIVHNGKRGAFAVMTDGSVRFLDQGISDEVFQAMCTFRGPLPPNFELNRQANCALVDGAKAAPPKK